MWSSAAGRPGSSGYTGPGSVTQRHAFRNTAVDRRAAERTRQFHAICQRDLATLSGVEKSPFGRRLLNAVAGRAAPTVRRQHGGLQRRPGDARPRGGVDGALRTLRRAGHRRGAAPRPDQRPAPAGLEPPGHVRHAGDLRDAAQIGHPRAGPAPAVARAALVARTEPPDAPGRGAGGQGGFVRCSRYFGQTGRC